MIHKVIQRRYNGSTNFHTQKWAAYEKGFGHTELEYCLGKMKSLFKKTSFTIQNQIKVLNYD